MQSRQATLSICLLWRAQRLTLVLRGWLTGTTRTSGWESWAREPFWARDVSRGSSKFFWLSVWQRHIGVEVERIWRAQKKWHPAPLAKETQQFCAQGHCICWRGSCQDSGSWVPGKHTGSCLSRERRKCQRTQRTGREKGEDRRKPRIKNRGG